MELVQPSQMVQQRFQRLGDRKKLQEAVNDDVKDGQEAQAHVAKVDGQVLRLELHGRVDLVRKSLKVQLLWVFLVTEQQILLTSDLGFCLHFPVYAEVLSQSDGSSVVRM